LPVKKDDVEYVAKLARLKLSEKEIEYFASQLGNIINYIGQLREVDISNIEPTSHVLHIQNVFRRDEIKPSLKPADVLKNARAKEEGLFKVPRVIEES
jgi:aspartyl-tRNA(Asn)/glutamyl-tRNA(Gln) amidotransferase subunit C